MKPQTITPGTTVEALTARGRRVTAKVYQITEECITLPYDWGRTEYWLWTEVAAVTLY